MKITCNREKMLHAFQTVAAIAPARSPKPILQNVKLEVAKDKATLMATDLEVGIRYEVAGVETDAPGAAVLPVARFGSILRESTDATFRIEAGDGGTTIRGERSQFKLPAENPQDFPPISEFGESSFYEISARLFRELIRRTIFATDNESSRYALGGVKLEWKDNLLTAVGTDGRRLAKMEGPAQSHGTPAPFGDVTVIPTRAMNLLERALAEDGSEVQLAVRQNDILVKNPRATIYSRLLEGRYPRSDFTASFGAFTPGGAGQASAQPAPSAPPSASAPVAPDVLPQQPSPAGTGGGNDGSANAPTATPTSPGFLPETQCTDVPQRGQKCVVNA